MFAAKEGHTEALSKLISAGADIYILDKVYIMCAH